MYYIMLKFPFLYVGLRKTIEDIFKFVGEKKLVRKKSGISNCFPNRHPGHALDLIFKISLRVCGPKVVTV